VISDAAVLSAIRADLDRSPWIGEGHRKVWARLGRSRRCSAAIRAFNEQLVHGRIYQIIDVRAAVRVFFERYNTAGSSRKWTTKSASRIPWENSGIKHVA
jgi:hypothetical protein